MKSDAHKKDLVSNAAAEARVWEEHASYESAEPHMEEQGNVLIEPFIRDCDFRVVVDLAGDPRLRVEARCFRRRREKAFMTLVTSPLARDVQPQDHPVTHG
jgi:hypothetical protein